MPTRRAFLETLAYPLAAAATSSALKAGVLDRAVEGLVNPVSHPGAPDKIAGDESFWFEVQQAFTPDRTIVNLNNGGVSPSPAVVQEAMKRHLDHSNTASAYVLWQLLEPQRESVRKGLARLFGCDSEEVAITRNASEGLETCQLGFGLQRGDEILTTNQDYPRMATTWRQRERREGIVLKEISIPVPCEDPDRIVARFEEAITPKTRLILMCHVVNLTGQILPVSSVVAMARKRGLPVIVDGAHAFAHLVFDRDDLGCDYYATSLHKWLFAPHGTGMLYVHRDKIRGLWPMMPAPAEMDDNIRKYEEIGTHPAANVLAIGEALAFHSGIGPRRKETRLRYLRDLWANRLVAHDRVRLHTSLKPEFSCGIATIQVDGVETAELARHLWDKHRILTTSINHAEFEGLRITPSVYTTVEELDRFCGAMESVIRGGLPKA